MEPLANEPPEWTAPGRDPRPVRAVEAIAWVALLGGVVASRWVVAPDVLFDWDSANYALGIRDFDVYEHQPHPPGYPVFIGLLKLLAWIPGPETRPFLLANLAFTLGILAMLGWMVRRDGGPVVALGTAVCLAVCPVFWFQGAVSAAYVAEAFSSVLVAASALAVARGTVPVWVGGVALGLAIGIRPNGVVTLAPAGVLGLWFARPNLRALGAWVGAFGAVCLAWFVPLMAAGGGLARYRVASAALFHWQLEAGSILSGDLESVADNTASLLMYLFDAVNVLALLLLPAVALATARRRVGRRTWALFGAWLLPGFLVYALHHLPKSGYVLTLAPGLFLAAGLAAALAARGLSRWARGVVVGGATLVSAGYLALNTLAFWTAIPFELLDNEDAPIPLPEGLLVSGDYGRIGLQYRTWPQRRVREIVDGMDPERDLGLFPFGAGELYRMETYYHPDHWLLATSVAHGMAFSLLGQPPMSASFGDYQVALLHADTPDWSWTQRTLVGLEGRVLGMYRAGHVLRVTLPRVPDRVVVFVPCPPCDVTATRGMRAGEILAVGAGYTARELRPVLSGTPPSDGLPSAP